MTFVEAIKTATASAMLNDPTIHVFGLGAVYPNGLDGSMGNLATEFAGRVHDTPCSEAAVTGMCVGAAINGIHPLVHHGRIEFSMFAVDALVTQAALWNYTFGDYPCPLTVRIAIGRQWGNGPQHTRSSKCVFATPGLKVVCPSSPRMAHVLLLSALQDKNPVIYLEPRWLYKLRGDDSEQCTNHPGVHSYIPLNRAQVIVLGDYATVVAVGDMVLEAVKAAKFLRQFGVRIEVIDLVSIYPIDLPTIKWSMLKTGKLIVADASTPAFSVAHEIIGSSGLPVLKGTVAVTCPDTPCPTATALTRSYYPNYIDIARAVTGEQYPHNETFEELNLPPTDDFDMLVAELQ